MTRKLTRRAEALQQNARDEGMWARLRRATAARIGLPRSGASLATAALLAFELARARARAAVSAALDEPRLGGDLAGLGLAVLFLDSAACDRQQFLMRPDLGGHLTVEARALLEQRANDFDVAFVVSAGLSARAVQMHAAPVLLRVRDALRDEGWRIAPVSVVRYGRIAIGDEIATALRATCVVVLIGERPGLSAPATMGAYLTWDPGPETTGGRRSSVCNIRPDAIGYAEAAETIVNLLRAMRVLRASGLHLNIEADPNED